MMTYCQNVYVNVSIADKALHYMQDGQGQLPPPRPTNRAMRRRPGLLQAACEDSCCKDLLGSAGGAETLTPRRLETHIWHAKRMQMIERWTPISCHQP